MEGPLKYAVLLVFQASHIWYTYIMAKKRKKSLLRVYVGQEQMSELDFQLEDDLAITSTSRYSIKEAEHIFHWVGESYPLRIDHLEKMIAALKENGATFVEIMYHGDHIGYYLSGLKFEELDTDADRQLKKKQLQVDIKMAQDKLKSFESQVGLAKKELRLKEEILKNL